MFTHNYLLIPKTTHSYLKNTRAVIYSKLKYSV